MKMEEDPFGGFNRHSGKIKHSHLISQVAEHSFFRSQRYFLKARANFEKQDKCGDTVENLFVLLLAMVSEMQCKFASIIETPWCFKSKNL